MRLELNLHQRLEQRMKLSQQMLQNLEMLQLPILDLRETITQELVENPTLELKQDVEEPDEVKPVAEESRQDAEDSEKLEILEEVAEDWYDQWREINHHRSGANLGQLEEEGDKRYEFLQNASTRSTSLREHLSNQLMLMDVTEEIKVTAELIINNIDDNGYLRLAASDIATILTPRYPWLQEGDLQEPVRNLAAKSVTAEQVLEAFQAKFAWMKFDDFVDVSTRWVRKNPPDVAARKLKEKYNEENFERLIQKVTTDYARYSAEAIALVLQPFYPDDSPEALFDRVRANPNRAMIEALAAMLSKTYPRHSLDILNQKVEQTLSLIQQMEPKGVGSRDLRECLLLQMDERLSLHPLLRRLIERHLDDIANNRLPKIARDFAADPEMLKELDVERVIDPNALIPDIQTLVEEIGKLNPKPGINYSVDRVPKVYPEVVIKHIDGKYEIILDDFYLPPITINRKYLEMLKDKTLSKEEREFIKRKIDAGRKLISAIEQRRSTIYRITSEILKHQMEFFEKGIEYLKPLKMQDVAQVIGVHISTVSRAISDKWIETPRGVFSLKFFFASAAQKAAPRPAYPYALGGPLVAGNNGQEAALDPKTRRVILDKIREIIDNENPKTPLSDLDIVDLLKRQGVVTARRTVAKYREELSIPSSRLRRHY